MTPADRLKEIDKLPEPDDFHDEWNWLINRVKRLTVALEFYGYEAIHNSHTEDKTIQYWTDNGIYDHGQRARKALESDE